MPTPDNYGLTPAVRPNLDRVIKTLENRRAGLKTRFSVFAVCAVCFAVGGALVLATANALIKDGSPVASAAAAALLLAGAVLAVVSAVFQAKIAAVDKPLRKYRAVRAGLVNAGFVYGNHREFFGKFLVFREEAGGRIAVTELARPLSPFLAEASDAFTLRLDGNLVFAGRVGEAAPGVLDFLVHPDYRYRKKSKPVYEKAELNIARRYGGGFSYAFPFRNAERRQFVSLAGYVC